LAVAEALQARGCDLLLLVSPKQVDQQAVSVANLPVATLPAVGLEAGHLGAFARGAWRAFQAARRLFAERPPAAVLAMGGFTAAPPVLAAKAHRAAAFLHEANAAPGRANRWLIHVVDQAFVYFPQAAARLGRRRALVTGMPVRRQFQPQEAAGCRLALGLDAERPVLLVTGGSQGALGLNDLVLRALPALAAAEPALQFIHLTGPNDLQRVREAYAAGQRKAVVRPFLTEMELALGAATLAASRAGASFLAELAAMRVPAILVPLPTAADNHQLHNARAFAQTGAARLLEQAKSTPELMAAEVSRLLRDEAARDDLRTALARWHFPGAAEQIADLVLEAITPARSRAKEQALATN
jgi:UDP-N-acetylglucosamine--N-acetylmuramyl-(pentapeptide) pyrophosphoryl-undecaprenol N-acetylglucosamine transferase